MFIISRTRKTRMDTDLVAELEEVWNIICHRISFCGSYNPKNKQTTIIEVNIKCYNHPSNDAVAICKNCNKGLCAQCATDTKVGITCKGVCESEITEIYEMIQYNKKARLNVSKNLSQSSVWIALIGIFFIVSSFFLTQTMGFLIVMGVLFLIGAMINYSASKRFKNR